MKRQITDSISENLTDSDLESTDKFYKGKLEIFQKFLPEPLTVIWKRKWKKVEKATLDE